MCNLYSNTIPQDAMRAMFSAQDRLGNQPPLPAIFPDGEAPICRMSEDGEPELIRARWGWDKAKFGWVTNARHLDKWPWKDVIDDPSKRCLIPASAFSEYHPTETYTPPGAKKPHKKAVWFAMTGEGERPPFALAGFWKVWSGSRKKDDPPGDYTVFVMLTTDANALVEPYHPKAMPVILKPEHYELWLHGEGADISQLQRPFPADDMRVAFIGEKRDAAA